VSTTRIVGVPLDLGASRRGVDMGPFAVRAAGLADRVRRLGHVVEDAGNLSVPDRGTFPSDSNGLDFLPAITEVCRALAPMLSSLAGDGPAVLGEHVVLLGVRDLDLPERAHVRAWGAQLYSMRDIDQRGLAACIAEAIARVTTGTSGFCVSFDADSVDPSAAPGVGTPVRGGLTFREAHLALESVADTGGVVGLDFVEVNPILDVKNETAELIVGLAASALGQRIV
jgi:arginase